MMTGTPIESNVWMAYLLTVFLVVTGFAVYDILYRRVPDRALVFFIPLAALAGLVLQLNILWVYLAMSTEQLVKCIAGVVRLRTGKWIHDLTRPQTIE